VTPEEWVGLVSVDLLSSVCLGWGVCHLLDTRRRRHYKTAVARIVEQKQLGFRAGRGLSQLVTDSTFEFIVEGRTYSGRANVAVAAPPDYDERERLRALKNAGSGLGGTVIVFYDPSNPSKYTMTIDDPARAFILMAFGLFWLVLYIYGLRTS
jgi:hypothetical protein